MKFKNLEHNILYRLDEERRGANFVKAVHTDVIYKAFADIPEKSITKTLRFLDNRGLLDLDPNAQKLSLTATGKAAVKNMRRHVEILGG